MCNYAEGLQGIKTFNYLQIPYKTVRTKNEPRGDTGYNKKTQKGAILL
jgi:hypothetical protein